MTENPLLRSIPKEHGFRFVPFEFENMPLIMDHNLDHDIYRLRQFTFLWLDGLEAEQTAFLHMGENAERLFLRRGGSDPWRWQDFLRAARRLDYEFLEVQQKTLEASDAVKALAIGNRFGPAEPWEPTLAQVRVGAALLKSIPAGLRLTADQPLPGMGKEGPRCHFQIHNCQRPHQAVRVEVMDDLDLFGFPKTNRGAEAMSEFQSRLRDYAAAGIAPPTIVRTGESCDLSLLEGVIKRLLTKFNGVQASDLEPGWANPDLETHPPE